MAEALQRPGDLTLRDTSLADALLTISESWNINIVVGSDVEGQVNGAFRNAPLHEILDSILQANGYAYRPVGRSLAIYRRGDESALSPLFQTATIPLGIARPEEIVEGAKLLASPQGRVQAIPSANSLVVFDFPQNIAAIRQFVAQLDAAARQSAADYASGAANMQSVDFAPQYIDAKSLKDVVQSLLSKDGKVAVMELENRIVVFDYPAHLKLVHDTLARLDQPRPQVRITALIYDLGIEDMERLGINWNQAGKWNADANGNPTGILSVDSVMTLPAGPTSPSSVMTFMNLSKHFDVTGVVDALRQVTNARLLADPTVTVVDRESAMIQIVTEIPFQQLTQTSQGGNIGTTAFREAGVTLTVLPKIAHDGTLQLDVTPTFSRLTGFTQGESPAPIIDKREAKTTVRVANGQTLVIGGLRQRGDTRDRRGVPYLSEMKYIGPLFRARDDSIRESELVVFITPEIVVPCRTHIRPREEAAQFKTRDLLERIPIAPNIEWPNCGEMTSVEGIHLGSPGPYPPEAIPAGTPQGEVDELYIPPTADPPAAAPTSSRGNHRVTRLPPIEAARPTTARKPQAPPPRTTTHPVRDWMKNVLR
jgi:general secretion pathway protein D